jgi:hypothetical protein
MAGKIEEISFFTSRRLEGEEARSELLLENRPTGVIVKGAYLEKQYQAQSGFVIFMSVSPFEDILKIYFLSPDLLILDGFELGFIYTDGSLADVEVMNSRVIHFSFFGPDRWELTILDRSRWGLNPSFFYSFLFPIYIDKIRLGGPIVRRWLLLRRIA